MLITLIQKEIMHHLLSARFVALILMCLLLIPLNFHINYQNYLQRQVDHQEAIKFENIEEARVKPMMPPDPEVEVSKFFLKPTPLSVFANGLEEVLPSYLGMTRNGITQGPPALFSAPLSYLLGQLDFLFVISTVFSLLALLFTFDTIAGERETGTLRIILANSIPRDLFLWGKLIGGYLVFVIPFLLSCIIGLLLLIWQGFPLSNPEIFFRVLGLTLVSLLYIAVFFAIGALISNYSDSSRTALIVAFTVWVFAVLITPRVGFLAAKLIVPTRTTQSVYMEKAAIRNDFNTELEKKRMEIMHAEVPIGAPGTTYIVGELAEKINESMKPFEEEYRLKFRNLSDKIDRSYQRKTEQQERVGETLSRISPISSLIYLATNITQTGKLKKSSYFQMAEHYYDVLDTDLFSKISDQTFGRSRTLPDNGKILPPPELEDTTLAKTFHQSVVDVLMLIFFAVVLTTGAFLKFFRSDI